MFRRPLLIILLLSVAAVLYACGGGGGGSSSSASAGGGAGADPQPIEATYIVCSPDSQNQEYCDYTGDGSCDDVEIQQAIDTAQFVNEQTKTGIQVMLREGTYNPKNGS